MFLHGRRELFMVLGKFRLGWSQAAFGNRSLVSMFG